MYRERVILFVVLYREIIIEILICNTSRIAGNFRYVRRFTSLAAYIRYVQIVYTYFFLDGNEKYALRSRRLIQGYLKIRAYN